MTATLYKFPQQKAKTHKRIKNIDGVKYFSNSQVKLLRRAVRDQAATGRMTAIKEWMAIDLLTCTGLRVSEAANLRCGDCKVGYDDNRVFVRNGKGWLSAHIVINEALKRHLKQFLKWKSGRREPVGRDDFVFVGQRGAITSQGIQQIVKKYLKQLGLYESGKSAHALRHSFAVELYGKSKDIRATQKQLRHVSIQSTQIYADITREEIQNQMKGLWR